jgi:hypothetical protein
MIYVLEKLKKIERLEIESRDLSKVPQDMTLWAGRHSWPASKWVLGASLPGFSRSAAAYILRGIAKSVYNGKL